MSHKLTLADSELNNKHRKTRKEVFLSRMDELMPWNQLEAVIGSSIQRLEKKEDRIRCHHGCR